MVERIPAALLEDDSGIWTQRYRDADTESGVNAAGSEEQWNICSHMAETVNIATVFYYQQITMALLSDFYSYINQSQIIHTYSKYM